MKKHNRLISVLLCLVMILSCFSMAAAIDEETVVVTYAIAGEGVYHTQTLTKGSSIGSTDYPNNPVREGKNFTGWYYNSAEGRVSVDTDFVPEGNITLLANMEDVITAYTVTYAIPGQGVYHVQTLSGGSSIGSSNYPSDPTSSSGCFNSWYYNENGNKITVTADFVPTGNITLLSQWKDSHNWGSVSCTDPKTCLDCGYTEGEALGHTWTDATCTAPKTCTVCGATEGEALGHTWADATCTAPKTCTVCGATEGEALGHTWADATCTAPKTCTVCGATEGEALGHTWTDATCTAPRTCTVCGATEGEALGHTWTDATCTAPRTCTVCGATEGEALSHTWADATCTAPRTCTVCGETEGEALDHTPEADDGDCTTPIHCAVCGIELVAGNASHTGGTATCTEKAKCAVCGMEYGELAAHTWSADYLAKDADADKHYHVCTACGIKDMGEAHTWNVEAANEETDKHCEVCGYVAEEQSGHVHAGTLVPGTDATCTKPGNKAYYTCSCGKWFQDATCLVEIADHDSVVIAVTDHTPEADDGDCTTPIHCAVCGLELVAGNASHTGGTATCTEKAKCAVCGMEYGELAAHTWSADYLSDNADANKHYHVCTVCATKDAGQTHTWNVEAATQDTDKHCEICGYVAEEQIGHTHVGVLVAAKEATCKDSGSNAYYVCSCGKWFEDATCTVEITDHDTVIVPALGHAPEWKDARDATETDKGYTGDKVCSRCGEVLEKGKEIPAIGKSDTKKPDNSSETKSPNASQEKPKTTPVNPKTGDSEMFILLGLMMVSCGGVIGTVAYRKKKIK